jgi:translation initiation factor 2A
VKPSPTGHAILVWSQTYVDTTGKSYYGEHSLQYVQILGGKLRTMVPVFDGQIHDLAWSPAGDSFIVISGMQPATATLYDKNSNPLFEFGKRYRNTIRIDPFSNATLIGGFGNLAGEVDFWSLDTSKEIGKTKAYCTVTVEWAADGKHLMTAVLHERVKVDNEVKIFKANGALLTSLSYHESELYDAIW